MEEYLKANCIPASEVKDKGITMVTLLPSLHKEFLKWKEVTPSHLRRRDHTTVKQLNAFVAELSADVPRL